MSENNNLPAKRVLPTPSELHYDVSQAFKNDQLKILLNQQPKSTWLKNHPMATKKVTDKLGTREVPAQYISIDKIEFLLDYIFQEWKVEILNVGQIFHSVYVTVRVHYLNPVTGEWSFHDGVGATKVQSDAKQPFSSDSIKAAGVQIGLPAAKSYAIKDAVEHLGDLFGRNINRADSPSFIGAYGDPKPTPPQDKTDERLDLLMKQCKTRSELKKFEKELSTPEDRTKYDELFKKLK